MNHLRAIKRSFFFFFGLCCTPYEPGSDTLPDAAARAPEWACLRAPLPITRLAAPPARITYLVPIVDFDSQPRAPVPVPELEISVCDSSSCDPPVPSCLDVLTPDCVDVRQAPGEPPFVYAVSFPYGFENGVLRLRAPRYANMDYVLGGPMVGTPDGAELVRGLAIAMPLQATAEQISLEMGSSPAPDHRTLAVRTLDCLGQRAPGVSVQSLTSEQGIPFVLSDDNRPTRNTELTSARGVTGLLELPTARVDIVGISPPGAPFGGPTSIDVAAGVITVAEIRPGIGVWGQ